MHLLPKQSVLRRLGTAPVTISQKALDHEQWWSDFGSSSRFFNEMDNIMRRGVSWSDEIIMWGEENGTRVDCVLANGRIDDVLVRVDARDIQFATLACIIEVAARLDFLLVTEDHYVLTPSLTKVLRAIRRSDAYRFVMDPKSFLEQLNDVPAPDTGGVDPK